MKKPIILSSIIIAFSMSPLEAETKCKTVLECANQMVELAHDLKQQNEQLQKEIDGLKTEMAKKETIARVNTLIGHVEALQAQARTFIPYDTQVRFLGNDGLYIYSHQEKNRDELDLVLSGAKDANTSWAIKRP